MSLFAAHEWLIAWRYLRARRFEGGVSVMTWISLIGISLAVFALIATLGVRTGFRNNFTEIILGSNAHATLYRPPFQNESGQIIRNFDGYQTIAKRLAAVDGVVRVAPVVRGQVMASANDRNIGVEVYGETLIDLQTLPLIASPKLSNGRLTDLPNGVAIGSGIAHELRLRVGDKITLISPDGVQTIFGSSPRVNVYEVVYIFSVGRYDIDRIRLYMPLKEAQSYFNREGVVDEFEILLNKPQQVDAMRATLIQASGVSKSAIWTWKDANGGYLQALQMEDNVMFIILSILVLIASMNIISGLIMLVKNKGRDIGILRTIGFTQAAILRIFFICGASIGIIGTILGIILGSLFIVYIDPIFYMVNHIVGGGIWDPSVRLLSNLPAELRLQDIIKAAVLSLGLSFTVTIFPARRAARLDPVEALRYE